MNSPGEQFGLSNESCSSTVSNRPTTSDRRNVNLYSQQHIEPESNELVHRSSYGFYNSNNNHDVFYRPGLPGRVGGENGPYLPYQTEGGVADANKFNGVTGDVGYTQETLQQHPSNGYYRSPQPTGPRFLGRSVCDSNTRSAIVAEYSRNIHNTCGTSEQTGLIRGSSNESSYMPMLKSLESRNHISSARIQSSFGSEPLETHKSKPSQLAPDCRSNQPTSIRSPVLYPWMKKMHMGSGM